MAIPALLSKKANAPVMMRITREEEHYIGRARPGIHSRVKVGFRKDGRITAIDMYTVSDNGPYDAQGDFRSAANTISLAYQPKRCGGAASTVLTNTPPKTSQRAPGGMQGIGIMEPIISKAARQARARSGRDPQDQRAGRQGAVRPRAAARPAGVRDERVRQGSARQGRASCSTGKRRRRAAASASGHEGARHRRRGQRRTPAARSASTACSSSSRTAGVQFQSGIGNLGTHSVIDVHRVAAEMLGVPWEQCDVVFGNTAKNLPWTCVSAGSQTAHAMTRAAHAAATDAIKKLQEIAAKTRGGNPEAYKVAGRHGVGGRAAA